MKELLTYLFCVFAVTNGCAQPKNAGNASGHSSRTNFSLDRIVHGNYDQFDVDALGNLYLLKEGQLKKISPAGDSMAVYNDVRRFGMPTSLDASNPFKTLMFFKPFATIVLLDNMLANRGVVNLRKSGIFSVNATAVSYDNKIWLFDEQDFKLKKLDEEGKVLLESNDLRQSASVAPQPEQLFDHEGTVYLYDSETGFVLLDYYGAYFKTLPFKGWHSVSVSNNKLFGLYQKKLVIYELKKLLLTEYELPESFSGVTHVRIIDGRIYLHKKDGIEIYSILN